MSQEFFLNLQDDICQQLMAFETSAKFLGDRWERAENGQIDQGGGLTKVLEGGEVFEKAGVNFSSVQGHLPRSMSKILTGRDTESPFKAMGISLVIHPVSPLIPTTHANLRHLQVAELEWYGGGMDLTPYYLFSEDCKYFHQILHDACEKFKVGSYAEFKTNCDKYFYLPHRQEARGIGGIFFDYLGKNEPDAHQKYFPLLQLLGPALMQAYLPIVQKRRDSEYTPAQKEFQLLRRGRYVEFNLIHDRGTKFGLETGGRTESILMSLPPQVVWKYNYHPTAGSKEAELLEVLKNPRDWLLA